MTDSPEAKQTRTFQIVAGALGLLLAGSLFFGFTKNSALSASQDEVAAQTEQVDTLTAEAESAQVLLDTAAVQVAACATALESADLFAAAFISADVWNSFTMEDSEALVALYETDAAACATPVAAA